MCDVSQAFARPHSVDQCALRDAMWQIAQQEGYRAAKVWGIHQCSANIGKPDTVRMRLQLMLDVMHERQVPMSITDLCDALAVSRHAVEHSIARGTGDGDLDWSTEMRKPQGHRNASRVRIYWPTGAEWMGDNDDA